MHSRRAGVAALLVTVVALSALAPARASTGPHEKKKQVDAAVRELGTEVAESSRRLAAAERLFSQASAKLPVAQQALARARGQLAAARANDVEMARKLAEARAAEKAARVALQKVVDSIAKHRGVTGRIARRAYAGGGMSQVAVALEAESPDEFASRLAYLRNVMNSERGILSRLGRAREELAEKRARLETVRRQVTVQRAAAAAALVRTKQLEQQASTAADAVAALVAQRREAVNAAAAEKAADQRRYQQMRAESDRLARIIRQRAAEARERARRAQRPSRSQLDGGLLSYPVNGPVTSGFGMRYHPLLGYTKLHTGTDFGVPTGTTVRSARGGTVIQSYYHGAYGHRVVVDHGYVNGRYLVTTYNHLSGSTSYVGERLSRGETVGRSGNTGWSTGPHLHFEVMVNGEFVDPLRYL
jgi:murein DD-endopeptidase MepM/ murein hydrolase activator NlpD